MSKQRRQRTKAMWRLRWSPRTKQAEKRRMNAATKTGGGDGEEEEEENYPLSGEEMIAPRKKAYEESKPSAEEGDPAYKLTMTGDVLWPMVARKKGKPKPLKYRGSGWWMHFRNPVKPRRRVNYQDLKRVGKVLKAEGMEFA